MPTPNCEILLHFKITVFYFNIFKNVMYSWGGKAEYSASLLQSSVSHDLSEITLKYRLAAQQTIIIINVDNSCDA